MKSLDIKPRKHQSKPKVVARPVAIEKSKPQSSKPLPWLLIGAAGLGILTIAILSILILPEARLILYVRSEPVTRDLEIRVDKNQEKASFAELVIPGIFVQKEIGVKKTVKASGTKNVGSKASGFVYIYNFSKNILILKAETTILNVAGKQYVFAQDVGNIRPTARIGLEDEEVDKTSLVPPMPLVAANPGEEYNLTPGTRLEILNEVFGSQPKLLYAVVSEDGLSGGSSREVKVVSEQDIASGFLAAKEELLSQAKTGMIEANPDLKLPDNAVLGEVLDEFTEARAGEEKEEFEANIKMRFTALGYRQEDVISVIRERIKRLLAENKKLDEQSSFQLVSAFATLDLAGGSGVLVNHFEGRVNYQINHQEIIEKVRGKNAQEIEEILLSRPEIEQIEVRFYPFWVNEAPKFAKKIRLDVSD